MSEENLQGDNPGQPVADNPSGPAAVDSGTVQPSGQATEATPAGELFKGVDPNRLPPEIKAHYDSMLRDYRDKTAKLSETTKSYEAAKQKAELYDQIAGQEEFVRLWNDYVQKATSTGQGDVQGNQELSKLKAELQEINQKLQLSELAEITDAFANAENEKGEKIHPNFDRFNEIYIGEIQSGQEREKFSMLRACIELASGSNPQEKLANGYKTMEQVYNAIFEEGKKAGMGRLQAKVQNGTQPPTNAGTGVSVTDKRPKNAAEALDMAKKGLMVSR